jgi:aryl carrier-like protein
LKYVFVGGEPLDSSTIETFKERLGLPLYNLYGPTECTINTISCELNIDSSSEIGRPISNTQIYILDNGLEPVPLGSTGEIYIGGSGLARGYLGRPGLTSEKFIANPFITDEEAKLGKNLRLYRSGDLGRYLSDGTIEFKGRIDEQVKIRGHRIELGEIENAYLGISGVEHSVVLALTSEHEKYLVCYLVLGEELSHGLERVGVFESSLSEEIGILGGDEYLAVVRDLKERSSETLASYMVPSHFVFIEKLPLTSNGKIDKKSLPSPDIESQISHNYVGPRDEIETRLCEIWSEVLGLERVGINDNFFEMGGDSILSIRVVSKLHSSGFTCSVKDIFEHPTVAALGLVLGDCVDESSAHAEQGLVVGDVSLTPIESWFFEQEHINPHHYNQSFVLSCRDKVDIVLLEESLQELLSHHDGLRLRFKRSSAGSWHQQIVPVSSCIESQAKICDYVDVASLSISRGVTESALISELGEELQSSLNIESGPMFRARLLDCSDGEKLLLVIHHLSVDGVSWHILLDDLSNLYESKQSGLNYVLPKKSYSYRQWALGLESYVDLPWVDQEVAYWSSIGPYASLPRDVTASSSSFDSYESVRVNLSVEQTSSLLQDVHQAYHTQMNDILLTVIGWAVILWSSTLRAMAVKMSLV